MNDKRRLDFNLLNKLLEDLYFNEHLTGTIKINSKNGMDYKIDVTPKDRYNIQKLEEKYG